MSVGATLEPVNSCDSNRIPFLSTFLWKWFSLFDAMKEQYMTHWKLVPGLIIYKVALKIAQYFQSSVQLFLTFFF